MYENDLAYVNALINACKRLKTSKLAKIDAFDKQELVQTLLRQAVETRSAIQTIRCIRTSIALLAQVCDASEQSVRSLCLNVKPIGDVSELAQSAITCLQLPGKLKTALNCLIIVYVQLSKQYRNAHS